MARKSKADKQKDLLSEARKRFEFGESYESENREEAREDLRFLAGDQWTTEAKDARKNRPMLTINRMPQFVRQVLGDIKQSRPSVKVHPVDSGADPEIAEIYQGLIRNIEVVSDAKEAYYAAAENQAAAGEGYWRVITDYADQGFEQDILIDKISNPFAVLFDPHAKKQTGEDASWCFVTERMSKEDFQAKYPKASMADFDDASQTADLANWYDGNSVRIAEYWYCEEETRLIGQLTTGEVIDLTDLEEPPEMPIATSRKVPQKCWYRSVINGAEVLEKPKKWAGKYLPVVRLVGEQINLGDRIIRHGVIRHARDSQRMYNYWRSAQTETVALQPKVPWLVDKSQIEGYEKYWSVANTANLPYLPIDATKGGGFVPKRESPPIASSGMANEIAMAAEDMKATTGIYDAALGAKSNETSGKAIMARQHEADVGTYAYHDNLARAIKYTGKILVDLIPRIYDTQRIVRVLGEDDSEQMAQINVVLPTGEKINDISVGKYDVTVTMGPSYSTKRMEAADGMLQALNANPNLWNVIGDLLAKNLDWPGADEMAKRLKKMAPPGLIEEEKPNPQAEQQAAMMAQMQQMMQQLEMAKLQAETADKQAEAVETQAKAEGQQLENIAAQMNLAAADGNLEQAVQARAMQMLLSMIQPQPMQ